MKNKKFFQDKLEDAVVDNPDLPMFFIKELLIIKSVKNPKSKPFTPDCIELVTDINCILL